MNTEHLKYGDIKMMDEEKAKENEIDAFSKGSIYLIFYQRTTAWFNIII